MSDKPASLMQSPEGYAEYKLQQALPEILETNLPSIEQIELELRGGQA